jgi:Na+-transporting methylmalonyl-CoA/oxaloacetate decarboxylase gamma subunit
MLLSEITFDFSNVTGFTIIVAIVGQVAVFIVLAMLYYVYRTIPQLINFSIRRKLKKEGRLVDESKDLHVESDVNAAISLALYMYLNEIHDEESDIITIRRANKSYTPWSSKIYSTNPYHRFPQR